MFSKVRLKKVSNSAVHRLHFDSMKRVDQTCLPFSSLVTGKFRSPSAPLSGLPQLKKQTHPKSAKLSADDHSWSLASRWPSYRLWTHGYFAYVFFFFPDVEKKTKNTTLQPSGRSAERLRCMGAIHGCRRARPAGTRQGHQMATFDQKISKRCKDPRMIINN